jgi:hypothetical protein
VILVAHRRSQERGWDLALTRGTEQVRRLFEIAGVGAHLRIVASLDELLTF